jgi:hypothetical protein
MKKKMRCSFCSSVAPQWIWGCSGTVPGMFQEQKEQPGTVLEHRCSSPLIPCAAMDLQGWNKWNTADPPAWQLLRFQPTTDR